ncbi:DMT family transporter [Companilactobacillus allii]|uniref:Multidrug transporter n=1 Tax=Companilactobacillus allii TaxID=1847728 RepID=A0A1P8Q4E3_9LACO|nr:DMT family transporter [Companilactobacillus allii]APX72649.1 multidrug transporter [Companilactobacillus allii]USQ69752.1 DMT family transporter [Companilactobacillus allii]
MKQMTTKKAQLLGVELNLISLLFSSISPVLNKFSLVSLNPVIGALFTSVFAAIFNLILILVMYHDFSIIKNKWVIALGLSNAIGVILQYIALTLLSPVTVTLIARIYLVYVFALSYIFLKEKLVKWDYLAIAMCIIGSVFVSTGRIQIDSIWGILCAFIYPLMYAINNIIAKYLVEDNNPGNVLFYNHLVSAVLLFVYALIIPGTFGGIQAKAVTFNFFGAFFNGFLSLLLFYTSLKFITAGKANIVRALGPIIVIVYSYFFFPIQISSNIIVGALLLIASTAIVTFTRSDTN